MTSSPVLALVLCFAPLSLARTVQASAAPAKATRGLIVHLSIINLSGKLREVHVRDSVVSLPVAKVVVLQVAVGEGV